MDDKFMERLGILKVRYDLTYNKLASVLGVSDDVAGNYLSGRTKMPMDKVIQLSAALRIDANWLLRGEGISPIEDLIVAEPIPPYTIRKSRAGRSVASNFRVHLRNLLAAIVEELPEARYDIFEVEGSSMENTFSQGDKLLCQADTVENIKDRRVYVLVIDDPVLKNYRESGIWVKRCSHRAQNGYISCSSDNKDTSEPYPTFRVKTENVLEVWYPVLKITPHMADPNRDIYERLDELEARIEMLESDRSE